MAAPYLSHEPGTGFARGPLKAGLVVADSDGNVYREEDIVFTGGAVNTSRKYMVVAKLGAVPVPLTESYEPSPDVSLGLVA